MTGNYGKAWSRTYKKAVENISDILGLLMEAYPGALTTSLSFKNPFELVVATILAAQSTDKQINKITPALFERYKNPYDFAAADLLELQEYIKSSGFFRNKAIAIIQCAKDLIEKFGGIVPDTIEDLVKLHGVGRKTANVVIAGAFGKQGIIVDTHMLRVSRLLGLTVNKDPSKIESDLQKIVPVDRWTDFSHKIVEHGRSICIARRPKCEICPISQYCRFFNLETGVKKG